MLYSELKSYDSPKHRIGDEIIPGVWYYGDLDLVYSEDEGGYYWYNSATHAFGDKIYHYKFEAIFDLKSTPLNFQAGFQF